MAKDDEKITLTKSELEAWYDAKKKDETMTPAEKKARQSIAEIVDERLRAFFTFDDDDEGGEGKRKVKAKSGAARFFDSLLGGADDDDDDEDDDE